MFSTRTRDASSCIRLRGAWLAGITCPRSVIDAVEEPVVRHVVVGEATERAIVEQQIPLVTRPALRVPPLAGDAPRPGARHDQRRRGAARDARRTPVAQRSA